MFKGRRPLSRRRWYSWKYTYAHHTAVVVDVSEGGKVLTILHQNVGAEGAAESEKKVVQEASLRMDSLQPGGWVRIYRPVERSSAGPKDADRDHWPSTAGAGDDS